MTTNTAPSTAKAIVTYPPSETGALVWKLEDVTLPPLSDNDVLVRVVATGICHTDLVFSSYPESSGMFPRVLGHEGAGYAVRVGSSVSHVKPNDAVLLSFSSCGTCSQCKSSHPAYCDDFSTLNFFGVPDMFHSSTGTATYSGKYFGQSSFASLTAVNGSSVVNVTDLVKGDEELLKMLAPLGCGMQTGAGAVTQIAQAGEHDSVVVLGLGGVGLAAIMAAKQASCPTIIGVDRFQSRLDLAHSLGATHTINTTTSSSTPSTTISSTTGLLQDSLSETVKALTSGKGGTVVIDTTGNMGLLGQWFELTATRGQMIVIGVPPIEAEVSVHLINLMQTGKQLRGCIEGDVTPSKYVPQMIQWYRDGKFPINKIVKFYPAAEFEKALEDMKDGNVIKPVLVW